MTERQRIGQLFMVGLAADRLGPQEIAAIASSHFGSVWFTAQTAEGVARVRAVADAVQALATEATTANVRFFIAANQEGGLIQALSGHGFSTIPTALAQGALSSPALRADAERWGRELRSAGVNLDFAPVADVVPPGTDAQNAPIGQLERAFGHEPATVRRHVEAFVSGMAAAGVATTVKHFPGLGRVAGNTDFTGAVRDAVTVRGDPYLDPFAGGIQAGAPFVMVSLATYERIDADHLAAFSPAVVTGLLRGDFHDAGVVISDDLGATAAVASVPAATRAIEFLDAGGDMVISKTLAPATAMVKAIASRARADDVFRVRVDESARRVLLAKAAFGLLPCGG
jgi:beta-N-acetylhexosaminidase